MKENKCEYYKKYSRECLIEVIEKAISSEDFMMAADIIDDYSMELEFVADDAEFELIESILCILYEILSKDNALDKLNNLLFLLEQFFYSHAKDLIKKIYFFKGINEYISFLDYAEEILDKYLKERQE